MRVQNNNATPRQFTLFHYVDFDLAGTPNGDSGTLVNAHFLKFSDGASKAAYKAYGAAHYEVANFLDS